MVIELIFLGAFCLITGIVGVIWPYKTTKMGERIESTKNMRSRLEVDLDGKRVSYNQVWGVITAIFGAVVLVLGFIF